MVRKSQAQSAGTHPGSYCKGEALVWIGVRYRHPDRWAAEVHVPRTNAKIWIGVFDSDREAALAYDAALFCLHGDRPPRGRKFNSPDVSLPDIPECVRLKLGITDVKDIAKKHVIQMGAFSPPVCIPAENQQVATVTAEAALGPTASAGVDANESLDATDGSLEETSAPFIFDPEELAAMMALATGDN